MAAVRALETVRPPLRSRHYRARKKLGLDKMGTAPRWEENGVVAAELTGMETELTGMETELELPSLPRPGREVS